jgi:hypothetical protein
MKGKEMKLHEVKAKLHNKVEFGFDIEENFRQKLKDSGIVIVYGYSDDLMEFDGAYREEAGVFDGGTVVMSEMDDKFNDTEIVARWCEVRGYDFVFETTIPHETFDVLGEASTYGPDEKYCRGIIFYIKDIFKK